MKQYAEISKASAVDVLRNCNSVSETVAASTKNFCRLNVQIVKEVAMRALVAEACDARWPGHTSCVSQNRFRVQMRCFAGSQGRDPAYVLKGQTRPTYIRTASPGLKT